MIGENMQLEDWLTKNHNVIGNYGAVALLKLQMPFLVDVVSQDLVADASQWCDNTVVQENFVALNRHFWFRSAAVAAQFKLLWGHRVDIRSR